MNIMEDMIGGQHIIYTTRTIEIMKCTITKRVTKEPTVKEFKKFKKFKKFKEFKEFKFYYKTIVFCSQVTVN